MKIEMREINQDVIEKITLENFQSLKNRTEIPLRPLTFLYGPNSAGKSSVYDALTFIDAFFNCHDSEINQFVNRWQHRQEGNERSELPAAPMIVEVKFYSECISNDRYWENKIGNNAPAEFWQGGFFDFLNDSDGSIDIRIEATAYMRASSLFDDFAVTVSVTGLKLFSISLSRDVDGDTDDELAYDLQFFQSGFGETITNLANRHQVDTDRLTSHITNCYISYAPFSLLPNHFNNSPFDNDLISIANHFLYGIGSAIFSPRIVQADRTTIANHNLSAIVSTNYRSPLKSLPHNFINAPDRATKNFKSLSTGTILDLMHAKFEAEHEHREQSYADDGRGDVGNTLISEPARETLHDFVNRCLSEHLFLDQGYQVKFDVCEILSPQPSTFPPFEVALIVSSLVDNAGRCMTFEDVGTGISCVLPVLAALHSWQSFIQQPELHLHPALQSALGDVFVEASHHAIHIVETHSEYLLLRCLRRIRETTLGKHAPLSPIALSADNVSVLYFDPQPDGTTTVKHLRISSQGDFIDRWPRGFFDERGKDLFDE